MRFSEFRQEKILEILRSNERASVNALAERLEVSPESIRRDLRALEINGFARRVYGGAVLTQTEADRPFGERSRVNAPEKNLIAEKAAGLIQDGMKIFVSSGTTTLACVKHLHKHQDLTIFTNSIAVAAHFFSHGWGTSVRVLGGPMVPEYQAIFGHATISALNGHRFDIAMMGASAVHIDHGFMGFGEDEVALHDAARLQANTTIMVADGSKFGRFGSVRAFGLGDAHHVITTTGIGNEFVGRFAELGVNLIQV
ncbi:DeoR/GlpR family DNA-binding transcription regulator [Mesorhizobium sp. GR13]|uniref:DeoR/GlpR family DNA-binding transcription regulator n=1 Tax=Mesorhizobium sp. GR13 TaxID=2562308 RepID=UPI0010C12CF4|nr:DeoR/GlpR family DNA-binding transcription regulator [Mesorhizobium sp. GR13]